VREQKPEVRWASKEKSWQARKTKEGLEAIDSADEKLAEIGGRGQKAANVDAFSPLFSTAASHDVPIPVRTDS